MKRLLLVGLSLSLLALAACSDANAATKNPVVVVDTSMGSFKIELYPDKAPITVKNFLTYVDEKHYDGTTFHRVIPNFMIQGGGFKPGLTSAKTEKDVIALEKKTHEPIKNESGNGLLNKRGAVAMARTRDLDSATAQFFVDVVDNAFLDENKYAVFGKVIDGMDVVDKIRKVETTSVLGGAMSDVPKKDVVIKSIHLESPTREK